MFVAVFVGLFVAGLAVRQMAYILMHGSIFGPLRERIGRWMDDGSGLAEKLNELFTCKVCMTAQVAIWTIALPLIVTGRLTGWTLGTLLGARLPWLAEVPLTMLVGFVLAMAVAAIAVGFWNLIEFRPSQQEALRQRYEADLAALRHQLAVTRRTSSEVAPHVPQSPFSFADFATIVAAVEKGCRGIGCGYARRDCREDTLIEQLRDWATASRNGTGDTDVAVLLGAMKEVMPGYFRNLHKHRQNDRELEAFRRRAFARLPKLPDLIAS